MTIKEDDVLLLAAHAEEEYSCLEIYVYDHDAGSLFVHHEAPLSAFPICLSSMRCGPVSDGKNFCAIGSFDPGIEIWNLDDASALEPVAVLGGRQKESETSSAADAQDADGKGKGKKKKKKKKKKKRREQLFRPYTPGSHKGAVMAMSWNNLQQ